MTTTNPRLPNHPLIHILLGLILMAIPVSVKAADTSKANTSNNSGVSQSTHELPPATNRTSTILPDPADPWNFHPRIMSNISKAAAQASSIDILFDGDSITAHWQMKEGKGVWDANFAKYHPFNLAMSGDTTQKLLWRLAQGQAKGLHPKLIFLLVGINNLRGDKYTPQEVADGVKEVVTQYRNVCPDAGIVVQGVFPWEESAANPHRERVKETNAILSKVDFGSKVIYMDFGAKFLSPDGSLSKEIMPDFLHPAEKGYQIWADAIMPVIKKYIPNKDS